MRVLGKNLQMYSVPEGVKLGHQEQHFVSSRAVRLFWLYEVLHWFPGDVCASPVKKKN